MQISRKLPVMSRRSRPHCVFSQLALMAAALLCGCGAGSSYSPTTSHPSSHVSGQAKGGQQPITGAAVQLYALGTTGDGSAATPLLTSAVTTDANGYFTITGFYTCPTPTSLVYVLISGGNPGLVSGTNNTAIALIAALGQCQYLSNLTFIYVTEITTVAAVAALSPYINSSTAIGSQPSEASALNSAFALASQLANTTTGSTPGTGVPAGESVPVVQINTLADAIAACVNSTGGIAGDGSICGNLFTYTTPYGLSSPTDVVAALLLIIDNPLNDLQNILSLSSASAPFQPVLATPPPSWAIALSTTNPLLTAAPASLGFAATTPEFNSPAQTIQITNSGTVPITLSGFSLTGANPGDFSLSNNCPSALSAAASCQLSAVFTPTATGVRYADVAIASSASITPIYVPLSGTGYAGSTPLITVNAITGTPINPRSYGANNIWFFVPGTAFPAFSSSLISNVGVTLMRYPGGFESESYEWDANTPETAATCTGNGKNPDDPNATCVANAVDGGYGNYTSTAGATPAQVISTLGAGNSSFVVRTADALKANDPGTYQTWATYAASLVTEYAYGGQVTDWQIGNEWYNMDSASKGPAQYQTALDNYAMLVAYYAPLMKAAAQTLGVPINIYATLNFNSPTYQQDAITLRQLVDTYGAQLNEGSNVWENDVDGLDLHIYSGIYPSLTGHSYPSVPLPQIPGTMSSIKALSGKTKVYVSEWGADLVDNNGLSGLQNSNIMLQVFGQLEQAGITQAAFWPPVFELGEPQTNSITMVQNSPTYPLNANGQAFDLLANDYQGLSLPTAVSNSTVSSIAALKGNQLVVFIMAGQVYKEAEQLQVNGFSFSTVAYANVLYAKGPDGTSTGTGPATAGTDVATNVITVNGVPTVQFTMDAGGSDRGTAWEIVELVLQ